MKKNLYIMMGLIVLASSCTKSGLIEVPEKQLASIEFDTYTGKTPATKASSVTIETLGENLGENYPVFQVNAFQNADYASPYMSKAVWCESMRLDDPTTTEVNEFSASWSYSGKKYWPDSGNLQFVAYGLNASEHFTPSTSGSYKNFTYTVPANTLDQKDLIVAVPVTQSVTSSTVVSLDFKHLLSRIGFTLQTTQTNDVNVTIKSIKLTGKFFEQGSVDLTAVGEDGKPYISPVDNGKEMTYSFFATNYNQDGKTAISYDCYIINNVPNTGYGIYPNKVLSATNGVPSDKDGADANDRYMMIIPGGEPTQLEVTYQLEGAQPQTIPIALSSMSNYDSFKTFEAGKAYEFIMRLSTDKIEFSGAVTTWPTNVSDTNIPRQ